MANINSSEYIFKFGSLIQFGVSYMQGFSTFADTFLSEYNSVKPDLDADGYSDSWVVWQKQNVQNIIDLYNQLDAQGKIPTSPI